MDTKNKSMAKKLGKFEVFHFGLMSVHGTLSHEIKQKSLRCNKNRFFGSPPTLLPNKRFLLNISDFYSS